MYNHEGRYVKTNMLDICEGFGNTCPQMLGREARRWIRQATRKCRVS
jgi:hypothetical protein